MREYGIVIVPKRTTFMDVHLPHDPASVSSASGPYGIGASGMVPWNRGQGPWEV